jgi:hypothetical protein
MWRHSRPDSHIFGTASFVLASTCLSLLLLGGISAAFAQGTVLFDNGVLIGRPEVTDPYLYDVDGSRLRNAPGTDTLRVQLLYGTSATSLTPHTGLARVRPSLETRPGVWHGLTATDDLMRSFPIGGVDTTIFLQVRAWDATTANLDFDAARTGGNKWGESAVFDYTQRMSNPAQLSDVWMLNFEGFQLVPEPSAYVLLALGGAVVFLCVRRKH